MVSTECIRDLVEPVLASVGLELWDVEVTRDVVRIMVERPAGPGGSVPVSDPAQSAPADQPRSGVDLDALSDASKVLSPVLDDHPEAVPVGRYQLEVSSPGIERTLRTPEQFRRYIGTEITVKTSQPVAGARRHRGRLLDVGTAGIDLAPDEASDTRLQLRFEQMERARTVMTWGPPAGGPRSGPTPTERRASAGTPAARRTAKARTTTAPTSKDPRS
jgi:ribosome maturation factor RimP